MTTPDSTTSIICSRCGDAKLPDEFHMDKKARNGRRSRCRLCDRLAGRAWYQANRARTDAATRQWRKDHPERTREIQRAHHQRNRSDHNLATARYGAQYPERAAAGRAIRDAIQAGDLIRGSCFACESTENVEGHHEDYSRPYEVMWFCCSCHKIYHLFVDRPENREIK